MATLNTDNHEWGVPDWPSSNADTELTNLFDDIDGDVWLRGVDSNRPPAGTAGRLYVATDTKKHYHDDGSSWVDITPNGWTVSDNGTGVVDGPSDLNFGADLSVTDDGDGTATVDFGGNADTVDGLHASDLTRPKNIAVLTSTDSTTNINQGSWVKIPWDSEIEVDNGYTHDSINSPTDITFDSAGTYRVSAMLTYYANGNVRINPGIKFAINGTRRDALGLSGYVRSGSGHNEGSNYLHEIITVNAGDTLTVQTSRYGNNGTVTLRSNESELSINQLSERTALSGDADTLDGKHASDFLLSAGDTMSGTLDMGGNDINVNAASNTSGAAGIIHPGYIQFENEERANVPASDGTLMHDNSEGLRHYDGGWTQVFTDGRPPSLGDLSDVSASGEGSGNGFAADTVDGNHASELQDNIFLAKNAGTDLNNSSWTNVQWPTPASMSDSAYSFDGQSVTFQEPGTFEIVAEADFTSTGASRQSPNMGLKLNGNWVGVIGRTGYMRDNEGHNASSIHARTVESVSSGDTIKALAQGNGDTSGSITANRSQFYIKRLNR